MFTIFHSVTVYASMSLYVCIMYVFTLCAYDSCGPEGLNSESRGRHKLYITVIAPYCM